MKIGAAGGRSSSFLSRRLAGAVAAILVVVTGLGRAADPPVQPAPPPAFKVLVFSKTLGFRHANIPLGIEAIRQIGLENGFAVDATEDSRAFSPENLALYKTVVFLSVTGDVLDQKQQAAFKDYVLGGGGFVGIHGAMFGSLACEGSWAWYGEFCGVTFKNHSAVVPARVDIEDRTNPSTAPITEPWRRADEWYNYLGTPRGAARVLATVDETTYKGGTVGRDHPITWCKAVGQGIMWYTAMGHTDAAFQEAPFLKHILGGIQLTARAKPGDLTPNSRSARANTEPGASSLATLTPGVQTGMNLLKNPGFEEAAAGAEDIPGWATFKESTGKVRITDKEAHGGRHAVAIPGASAVQQNLGTAPAGAYLARCWVRSETTQPVTFLIQDPDRPWAGYGLAEITVFAGEWTQIQAFCVLDQPGSLTLALGGMSKEFNLYHGVAGETDFPLLADDFKLFRCEPKPGPEPVVNDQITLASPNPEPLTYKDIPQPVTDPSHSFSGTPIMIGRHLGARLRQNDGALQVGVFRSPVTPQGQPQGCVILPAPPFPGSKCSLVRERGRTGLRVSTETGDRAYTAWFTAQGLIRIESSQVPQFQVRDCRLRYGLLPSFVGSDICYAPASMPAGDRFQIPSTQWFVGLASGNDCMLVAVWDDPSQAVSLGLAGTGEDRLIDSFNIAPGTNGFGLSIVSHPGIWRRQTLNEDWLGEYTPLDWTPPFPARWMGCFLVSPGGPPSFREPYMEYSFPIADAKTRMWGVWFEDWNHYPFFFEGPRTIAHFEKTFIPQGEALFYFLEPAAADLYSPVDIVQQALGPEKAAALLDFDANHIRKLTYSTPDQFMFDRPVCATTTRLSKIKQQEKATVGVDLATHLYEFIREIRHRVDQYVAFFNRMDTYLGEQAQAHPELQDYAAELRELVTMAKSQSEPIYAAPLDAVQQKTEAMKVLLRQGQDDGFRCGDLDVRGPAGAQDDLCRRYSRLVIRLFETAAAKCGDSPQKAVIAGEVWRQSRAVLRQPTRWEPRRTLYFSEP